MARQEESNEELQSSSKLSALTGIPERTITRILDVAGVKSVKAKGYPVGQAVRAIVTSFKTKSESIDAQVEQDKAAKLRAERETAQVEAAEAKKEFYLRTHVHAVWRDRYTKIRVAILNRRDISEETKFDLLKEIASQQINRGEINLNEQQPA